jgi:hypothetical protein
LLLWADRLFVLAANTEGDYRIRAKLSESLPAHSPAQSRINHRVFRTRAWFIAERGGTARGVCLVSAGNIPAEHNNKQYDFNARNADVTFTNLLPSTA